MKYIEIKFINSSKPNHRLKVENGSLRNSEEELETKYQELQNKFDVHQFNAAESKSLKIKVSYAKKTIQILEEENKKLQEEKY